MLDLNLIPTVFEPIYIKKVNFITLLYNPHSQKGMTLLNKKADTLFKQIDGIKKVGDFLKKTDSFKLDLSKNEVLQVFDNLNKHDIINFKGLKNLDVIKFNRENNPLTVWLSITEQCNFRCTYCFVNKNPKKMSKDTIEKTLDKLYELGKKYKHSQIILALAGGEPLLELNLIKNIIEKTKKLEGKSKKFFYISIVTNGSLLTEKTAEYFKKHEVKVAISVDGIGDFNDLTRKFVNGLGTFKYIQKGLDIANKYNILSYVGVTVTLSNIKGLPLFVKYCMKNKIKLKIEFFKKTNSFCGENVISNVESIIPFYKKTLKAIYSFYESKKIPHSPLLDHVLIDRLRYPMGVSDFACFAGQFYFSVTSEGKIEYCPASGLKLGTIKDKDFILKARSDKSFPLFQRKSVEKIAECQKCLWKYICSGGCPMERFYLNKDGSKPSPKCRIYKSLMNMILKFEAKRIIRANYY